MKYGEVVTLKDEGLAQWTPIDPRIQKVMFSFKRNDVYLCWELPPSLFFVFLNIKCTLQIGKNIIESIVHTYYYETIDAFHFFSNNINIYKYLFNFYGLLFFVCFVFTPLFFFIVKLFSLLFRLFSYHSIKYKVWTLI